MSIEILTVSLSDESIDRIVTALHARIQHPQTVTQSEPPSPNFSQSAEPSGFQQQPDPWQNGSSIPPAQPQMYQPTPSSQVQPQYQQPQGPPPAVQQGPPDRYCAHGKMRYVPAGTYKSGPRMGQPRGAFYGCPTERGTPGQCAIQPVNG